MVYIPKLSRFILLPNHKPLLSELILLVNSKTVTKQKGRDEAKLVSIFNSKRNDLRFNSVLIL